MSAGSRLTIRHHITCVVAACSLGGLLLAGAVAAGYRDLDLRTQDLTHRSHGVLQMGFLRERVATWLVLTDTIFIEVEETSGVLEEASIARGKELLTYATKLRASSFLAGNQHKFGQVIAEIQEIQNELGSMRDPWNGSLAERQRAARERIDMLARPLPQKIHSLEAEMVARQSTESNSILDQRNTLRVLSWIGGLGYLAGIFLVWRWTTLRLVKPLQTLTESARHALEAGKGLEVDHHGPAEVHQLSKTLSTLVNTLEQARDSMHVKAAETEAVLEAVPAILIGLGPEGEIDLWNGAATRSFGLLPKQALNRPLLDVPIPWSREETPREFLRTIGREHCQLMPDVAYIDVQGNSKLLAVTTTPVSHGPRGTGLLILGTDITEHRSLEAQVRHSQKLESVGQLAAGIAHEINTPIQYVGHSIHFLQEAFCDMGLVLSEYRKLRECVGDLEIVSESIGLIEEAEEEADMELLEKEVPGAIARAVDGVDRVANIVGAMKRFAHPGAAEFAPADLNDAVRTTLIVANNEIRYVANVNQQLGSIPLVECALGDINQVILNLVVNAAHAIAEKVEGSKEKGTITVRTRHRNDRVVIEVSDTGNGIPKDVAESIFDPFFTTKEVGKGTGQGLAIAHTIISDKHGGSLMFRSTVGQGTTFFIELPIRQRMVA